MNAGKTLGIPNESLTNGSLNTWTNHSQGLVVPGSCHNKQCSPLRLTETVCGTGTNLVTQIFSYCSFFREIYPHYTQYHYIENVYLWVFMSTSEYSFTVIINKTCVLSVIILFLCFISFSENTTFIPVHVSTMRGISLCRGTIHYLFKWNILNTMLIYYNYFT